MTESHSDEISLDRLPPHSAEAEQGVLGCILLSPLPCLDECVSKVRSEFFYDLRHRYLYDALVQMYSAQLHIDLITLQQWLKDRQLLEPVGGLAYISHLPDCVPTAALLDSYIYIVREKFILRKTIQTCTDMITEAYNFAGQDVDEFVDRFERNVHAITDTERHALPKMQDLVNDAVNRIEQYHQNQGKIDGISTGFPDMDRMTWGLHGGELIIVAGRPGMGKSALAMQIAEYAAVEQKIPTGVFSLEMSASQLVMRSLCSGARVNLRDIRSGHLVERDFPKLTASAARLAHAPLYIDDISGLSILRLRAKARRMAALYNIKLLVVDYLQLLASDKKCDNRQQEIADISAGLKGLAKDLNIPVIALSQLNRELDKDKHRRPRLSDLRESGAIEQDADLVGLLYQPAQGEEDTSFNETIPTNLLIAKQRNGPTGDVELMFRKPCTRFESAARISADDLPIQTRTPYPD